MITKILKNKILILIVFPVFFTLIIYLYSFYSLDNPSFNSNRLLPEEAYLVVLHEVYNHSLNDINDITFDDIKDKFTYQYVMVRNNGTVYLLDQDNRSIIKTIDNITPPITNGIHYAWEIKTNSSKVYVDSISGQIISISNKTL
jgi:hypothetical protein